AFVKAGEENAKNLSSIKKELNILIESHIEVAKGIIQILCQRLKTSINRGHKEDKKAEAPEQETAIDSDALYQYGDIRARLRIVFENYQIFQ
ncbi:MAG: hypothetical protein VSS52_012505, partial [Thiotrichaceae bacterium]|nr:hypothetical protein [Thiotrichaceae bacterium]